MEIHHDCWSEILKYIDDGATYKSAIWTCKRFWKYFESRHIEYVRKYSNHLWTLIKMFPDKKWDWFRISFNPNTTWNIIVNNPQYNWYCPGISTNPNITWDIVVNNPQYNWSFSDLSYNKFSK